jgi:hypothetical protein
MEVKICSMIYGGKKLKYYNGVLQRWTQKGKEEA